MKIAIRAGVLGLALAAAGCGAPSPSPPAAATAPVVKSDEAAAIDGTRQLAEQGDVDAQLTLGLRYKIGEGVPLDYAEALKWLRMAANQGSHDAQQYLGVMYDAGQGVPQDYVQAYMWFSLAADGADRNAIRGRNKVSDKMSAAQITEAQTLAQAWKQTPVEVK